MDNDIIIEDNYPEARVAYPNATEGFCFSDNKEVNQNITIKSADGATYTIKSKKPGSGLFAIKNGVLNLQNVTLDGGAIYHENGVAAVNCPKRTATFIEISDKSTLNLGEDATIQNVYRTSDKYAIFVNDGSNININGGKIIGCKALAKACGGAIYAGGNSSVIMNDGSITDCSVYAAEGGDGGAIYVDDSSRLRLARGIISGCKASNKGDAIYFAGSSDSKYHVALPGGGLKITIPLTDAGNSRNSDARIVGYRGIYKNSIGDKEATISDFLYYELNVDLNGGVGADGDSSLSAIYISKDADSFFVFDYLPNDLKKDNVKLSGWECEGSKIIDRKRTIFHFLDGKNSISTKTLKAVYDGGEEHVSTYWELQHAIYCAQGTKTIFIDNDIIINTDFDITGKSLYPDAVEAVDSKGQRLYPNAKRGYCLSDNEWLSNRFIIIKSSEDGPFKIKYQKKNSGLFAFRGSVVRFENIIIDGDNVARSKNFIDASKYSTIEFGPGAILQNVKASLKAGVICLDKSMLTLEENSFIIRIPFPVDF